MEKFTEQVEWAQVEWTISKKVKKVVEWVKEKTQLETFEIDSYILEILINDPELDFNKKDINKLIELYEFVLNVKILGFANIVFLKDELLKKLEKYNPWIKTNHYSEWEKISLKISY